jgi:hypothetical protein
MLSMPPDAPIELSERARSLWMDLAAAYDEIEIALGHPEGTPLKGLAERIVALEHELRPLVAQLAALRTRSEHDPRLPPIWAETDRVVERLANRQPTLVRAALAARDDAASRLARLRNDRRQRALYGGPTEAEPHFTSQRA